MKDKRIFALNAFFQAAYYFSFSGVMVYSLLYLQKYGLTTWEIGIIFTLANFTGVFLQLITSKMADSGKMISLKGLLIIHALALAAFMAMPAFFTVSKLIKSLSFLAYIAILLSVQALLNSVPVIFERAGHKISFAVLRGMGSGFFGITTLLLGQYFEINPINQLSMILFILALLFLLSILLLPPIPEAKDIKESETVYIEEGGGVNFYKKYPVFIPLVFAFILVFLGHQMINNYLALIVQNVGGGPGQIGLASMLGTVMEMVILFSYIKIRKRISDLNLLIFSAIMFTVKIGLLSIAHNYLIVLFSQILQLFAFGIFVAAISYFAAQYVDKKDLVNGQSVSTIIMSVAGGLGSLLGGYLLAIMPVRRALFIGFLISLVGAGIVALTLIKFKKNQEDLSNSNF